jgi:RNA polymerase sigma factor (sigma-70 family)
MIAAIRADRVPIRRRIERPRKDETLAAVGANRKPGAKVEWADLIGRVASHGDREAFKSLFEHFAPRIKGLMLKAGCNADDAEEIAQNTLIAVWRKANQFDPASTGSAAWIFTIARNLRIDLLRRAARTGQAGHDAALADSPDPAESADVLISRVENTVRVEAAIARLSAEQSRVIRLSFIEEQPHPEIASLLGIPLGTVKSRIRLAMNRLRELLDDAS